MKTIKNNGNIPYNKQEKGKKIKSNIINNQYNNYNFNDNHFLNDENIKIYVSKKNNIYQNLFINKKIYDSNTKKKSKNKNNIYYDYEEELSHNNNSNMKELNNKYYTNNNSINNGHNFNDNSLIKHFEKLKEMNSSLNNLLTDIQKNIKTTSNRKATKQKININNNFEQSNQNKNDNNIEEKSNLIVKEIIVNNNENNENDVNKNNNEKEKDINIDNNLFLHTQQKPKKELDNINIDINYDFNSDYKIINKKPNTTGKNKNKSKNKNDKNKIDFSAFINTPKKANNNNPRTIIKYFIDESGKNEINICGIKTNKNLSRIKFKELTQEQENKIKILCKKNNIKNYYININDLINDLYKYKVKYFEIMKNLDSNKEQKEKEFDDNLTKLKKENEYLNKQKNFLINELTKSIYHNEKLEQRYKNELERIDAYVNKINFDIKEKKV